MKTAAVLGASGFLGLELCDLLRSHKLKLLLSSRNGGTFENTPIAKVDLTKSGALSQWAGNPKIDVIFYLSSVMPNEFTGREFEAVEQNLKMHEEVCRLWTKHRCHLVYASTGAIYGTAPVPWRENGPVAPDSFYAVSKLIGEQVFQIAAHKEKLPFTALRIKAPYGFKRSNKTVVNIFMERALADQDLELLGRGQRKQDFIYTKDVARAFWLSYSKKRSGVYNVASGKAVTMMQLARAVIQAAGSKSKIIFKDQPDPQETIKVKVDINKARRELGFKPKYSLAQGLKDMAVR